jgi:hypothetical protein
MLAIIPCSVQDRVRQDWRSSPPRLHACRRQLAIIPLMRSLPLCAIIALCACSREDISVYTVRKEGEAAPIASSAGPADAPAADAGPLRWSVPKGWREQPASGMRLAAFLAPGGKKPAEVSVVSLPGEAGGDLANVNRWRNQMGLAPIAQRELSAQSRRVSTRAGEVLLVDLKAGGRGTVAAMLAREGRTWFFKMTGEEAAVAAARGSFESFLGSLRLGR